MFHFEGNGIIVGVKESLDSFTFSRYTDTKQNLMNLDFLNFSFRNFCIKLFIRNVS